MKKLFFTLAMVLTAISSWATTDWALGDDVAYYLYNVETGMFLKGGNNWGTKAVVSTTGETFKLADTGAIICTRAGNGLFIDNPNGLFVDMGTQNRNYIWTITKNEDGTCYIRIAGDDGTYGSESVYEQAYLGYTMHYVAGSTSDYNVSPIGAKRATNAAITWQILTADEYNAIQETVSAAVDARKAAWPVVSSAKKSTLADKSNLTTILNPSSTSEEIATAVEALKSQLVNASTDAPTDLTWKLTNPDCNDGETGWNITAGNKNMQGGESINYNAESWRSAFDIYQTVEVPNGVYELTAQAALTDYANLYDGANYAVVYANEVSAPFNSMEDTDRGSSMATMSNAFSAGRYYAGPVKVTVTNGSLQIGVKNTRTDTWCIWDNFELKYYGIDLTELKNTLDERLAIAKAITGYMGAEEKTALDAAIEEGEGCEQTAEALESAISALNAAIPAAEASIKVYAQAYATVTLAYNKANAVGIDIEENVDEFQEAYLTGALNGTTEANAVMAAYEAALTAKLADCVTSTTKITNPSFEEGNLNGWTSADGGVVASNGNFTIATGSYFVEKWTPSTGTLTNGTLTQTLTDMPAGEYILTAEAQNWMQKDGSATTGFYITIGDQQVEVTEVSGTYAVAFTLETKGDLTIGAKIEDCAGNWICVDNFQLYFNGIDLTVLNEEIEKATAQYNNYDADAEYAIALKAAIKTAEDASILTAKDLDDAVKALQAAEATAALAWRVAHYAVLEDGKYCIKNTDGRWLGAGNNWGTQASLLAHPEYVELTKLSDGKYNIKSQVNNGGDSQYFNGSYMDGTATAIEIITVDGESYLSNGSVYYVANGNVIGNTGDMTDACVWTVLSIDEMDAKMADATADAPYDVTYKVLDPGFGRNNVNWNTAWTVTNAQTNGDNANKVAESWHTNTFSMKQTIAGLPNGLYEVKCNAVYTQDEDNLPYIFVNDIKATFNKTTDSFSAASAYGTSFAAGNYSMSIKVLVTDGSITLGAASEGNTSNWSVWDNFQLYYLGNSIEVPVSVNSTAKYGTFCAPFDVEIAYYVNGYTVEEVTDNVLTLSEIANHKIPAHTPIVINYNNGTYIETFTGTVTKGTPKAGLLVGTYNNITAPEGTYVLQLQNGKAGFYQVGETKPTVKAFRAYLQTESEVKGFYFNQTDAIDAIEALTNGAKIYDINGRELNKLQKGINIVNGCKILVK